MDNNRSSLKAHIWRYALMMLFLLQTTVNALWISFNKAPLPWDTANHTYISLRIAQKLQSLDFAGILHVSSYYPIGVHTASALVVLVSGIHIVVLQYLGTIYLIGTLIAIFLYVKTLCKSEAVAFLTVLFFSLSPIVFNWSRFLMLDIPSVGALFAGLYFFEKSDRLTRRSNALLFFVCVALLAMAKWTGVVYLTIPGLLFLLSFVKSSTAVKRTMLTNIVFGLMIATVITLPWYLANFHDLVFLGKTYSVDHSHPNQTHIWQLNDFLDYLRIFIRDQVTFIPAMIFLISLLALPFLKISRRYFIPAMFFGNLVFFSVLGNKDSRFTMHVVVFACLAFALLCRALYHKSKVLAITAITLLASLQLGYYLVSSFRSPVFEVQALPVRLPILGTFHTLMINKDLVKAYDPNDWSMVELMADLKPHVHDGDKLLVVSEWEHLNPSNIRVVTAAQGMDKLEVDTADIVYLKEHFDTDEFPTQQVLEDYVRDKNYLLVAENFVGSPILLNGKAVAQLQLFVNGSSKNLCNQFQATASPTNTTCIVSADETLVTTSDIAINTVAASAGQKTITGFAEVFCKWGCSFAVVKEPTAPTTTAPQLELIRTYTLPNGSVEHLYKVGTKN